uniref:UDP-N-acetylmuramoyl-tripeptide--D-alanyl-D-alanine ligase n=1 Tax=Timema poppense TaxID=170557 RepID=A0A7R9H9H2_TIMPO|nr:unnamed protein product [Timema poppensis]
MFKWNTNNIIDATGGRGVNGCNWTHSSNISTDTRSIKKGDLFIALKGKNFDGHNFLHEAFLKGAAAAIVSEGLPLTILKAPKNCQYLILEMGMNKAGEIKELSKISNPNIAVITNIEPAHTENFSSLFDVAQAKLEILYGMKSNAVVQSLGLDLSKLPLALKNFSVTKGRGNIHKVKYNKKYIHLIDDSYNASPASMKTAIKTLSTYSNQRKVALLGDMLELGDKSIEFHTDLVKIVTENNIDKIYTVGKFMLELHELLPDNIRGAHFNDSNQLKSDLANIIQNNDAILVKGSRRMKMGLIVREFIIEY